MAVVLQDKYYLRSLHAEIDLFDRKLAHMLKYDTFPTEEARDAAATKMVAKRELLARPARQLAKDGIEFDPAQLPRSFRAEMEESELEPAAPHAEDDAAATAPTRQHVASSPESHYAGTALDYRRYLPAAKKTRAAKTSA